MNYINRVTNVGLFFHFWNELVLLPPPRSVIVQRQPRGRKYGFGMNTMVGLKGLPAGVCHQLRSSQQILLKEIWAAHFYATTSVSKGLEVRKLELQNYDTNQLSLLSLVMCFLSLTVSLLDKDRHNKRAHALKVLERDSGTYCAINISYDYYYYYYQKSLQRGAPEPGTQR